MKPAVRRGLLFLAMVVTGIAAVLLLADPFATRHTAHVESLTGAEDPGGKLRVKSPGVEGEPQVVFGELDFDIVRPVETSPGVTEDRVAARVHILSARPEPGGVFVAQGPTVHVLDTATGAERGTLSGNQARFLTGGGTGADITLDLSTLHAEDWSLQGDVRGTFPLPDGQTAHLQCEQLDVHGEQVSAPGPSSWTRDDVSLSGLDLHWDFATGRLIYDAAAHIALPPAEGRPGLDLDATGGLTWTVPPDAPDPRTASYGELRGPVSGTASDGSRLAAQTVLVDGRTNTLVLQGDARLVRRAPDGSETRVAASRITAITDVDGQLTRADAQGGVRVDAVPVTGEAAWLTTDAVTLEGDHVHAPGRVDWTREAFAVAGDELDWDRATGRLSLARNAVLSVVEGSGHPWAGLRLLSPGGLTWQAPPGAPDALAQGRGELHGPVTGTLPDGTTLAAASVFCDGPARQVRLVGGASFRRVLHGEETRLDAHEVTLVADEQGGLALGAAQGDVVVLSGPPGQPRGRLQSQSLQREGGLLTAPGHVSWSRDDVSGTGEGLAWDEPGGRVDMLRDAHITLVLPESRLQYQLVAANGLTWTVPAGATDAIEGRGELRGRVTGNGSDGSTLVADRVLVDGPARSLELLGAARLDVVDPKGGPPATLEGDRLLLASHPDGETLGAVGPATFALGALHGSGTDLAWDGRIGHLRIERDVRMAQPAAPGQPDVVLSADGPLDWLVPPGAADPLRAGRGDVQGSVRVESGGRTLTTPHLIVAGPAGTTELRGPSRVESTAPDGLSLKAEELITVGSTPDGTPVTLHAVGQAEAWMRPADGGAPLHVAADQIDADRAAHRVELRGHALVERVDGERRLVAHAGERVSVRTDEQDKPVWLEATGGVTLSSNDMQATGTSLTWDVPADLARLEGPGELTSAGLRMSFSAAEIHPDSERFRIEHSVVHVQH